MARKARKANQAGTEPRAFPDSVSDGNGGRGDHGGPSPLCGFVCVTGWVRVFLLSSLVLSFRGGHIVEIFYLPVFSGMCVLVDMKALLRPVSVQVRF